MGPKCFLALQNVVGDDLIVTDGTTLLGGDDKAGIAIIMSAVEDLIASRKEHGLIAAVFTPDEEIGRGVECFKLDKFLVDYAFTVDGDCIDAIDYKTFNAAQAHLTYIIRGHDFEKFKVFKDQMQEWVRIMNEKYDGRFELKMHDQYYNMFQYMQGDMRSVNRAKKSYGKSWDCACFNSNSWRNRWGNAYFQRFDLSKFRCGFI